MQADFVEGLAFQHKTSVKVPRSLPSKATDNIQMILMQNQLLNPHLYKSLELGKAELLDDLPRLLVRFRL